MIHKNLVRPIEEEIKIIDDFYINRNSIVTKDSILRLIDFLNSSLEEGLEIYLDDDNTGFCLCMRKIVKNPNYKTELKEYERKVKENQDAIKEEANKLSNRLLKFYNRHKDIVDALMKNEKI